MVLIVFGIATRVCQAKTIPIDALIMAHKETNSIGTCLFEGSELGRSFHSNHKL
jgi:hypothetical protein